MEYQKPMLIFFRALVSTIQGGKEIKSTMDSKGMFPWFTIPAYQGDE